MTSVHQSPTSLVWLVTGCSTGIGRSIVTQALAAGQRVIATGRSASRLQDLEGQGAKIAEVDVNASMSDIEEFAKKALAVYGRIDVLVNNAGYAQLGTIEETGPGKLAQQYHTNVFAALNVTQAFLPAMRAQRSGTIYMIGSVAAYQFLPAAGLYDSSKAGLRGLTHSLNAEVKHLGIRVCHIEPGFFRTAVVSSLYDKRSGSTGLPVDRTIKDYDESREGTINIFTNVDGHQQGDPEKLGKLLVDLTFSTGIAAGKTFPDALAVGSDSVEIIEQVLKEDLRRIQEWKEISVSTDGDW
ncbi:hypothetical protein F5884DRAFT_894155 [Xylogone sp. PMI_703]|nr:hypothetical protein F5884DRAFT_894155 [Xylogone sp. PMI_703]